LLANETVVHLNKKYCYICSSKFIKMGQHVEWGADTLDKYPQCTKIENEKQSLLNLGYLAKLPGRCEVSLRL
jgi:hypothetical protein